MKKKLPKKIEDTEHPDRIKEEARRIRDDLGSKGIQKIDTDLVVRERVDFWCVIQIQDKNTARLKYESPGTSEYFDFNID